MRSQHFKKHVILIFFLFCTAIMIDTADAAPPLKISGNPPNGVLFQPYTATLTGNNGTTPYTWSVIAGSLPPGLTLTPSPSPSLTAVISGTPTQAGTFSFTVMLTDSSTPVGNDINAITIKIVAGACAFTGATTGGISFNLIDPSTLPGPILGTVTQQIPFTCTAGTAYTVTANPASGWMIVSGASTIPYSPDFITSGTGLGITPINLLTTNSRIIQADYANAVAGLYSNNQPITLTVSWAGGSISATVPLGGVSGSVMNTCVVSQSAGALTFTIDPSLVGSTTATIPQDLLIKCTMAAPVNITAISACGGAAPVLDSSYPACGGSTIPYTFTLLPGAMGQGFGAGKDIALGIGGTVTSANYANAPVGSYGDLQTITVSY